MSSEALAPPVHRATAPPPTPIPAQAAWVRGLNGLGHTLDRFGLAPPRLDPDRLIRDAERRAGLADWGGLDVRGPLRVLCDAFEDEARLSPMGREVVHRDLRDQLAKRLRLEALFRRTPDILRTPLESPLIIAGMPRSGTTLLHRLLALDPAARSLRLWEAQWPRAPQSGWRARLDARPLRSRLVVRWLAAFAPDLAAAHEVAADGPEECNPLFSPTFQFPSYGFIARLPSYMEWLRRQPMDGVYAHYRRMLQLLSFREPPRRWVLKAPGHTAHLDELLRALPTARIVLPHREPRQVVPSASSLCAAMRRILSERVDPREIGPAIAGWLAADFERAIDAARRAGPDRVLPVAYDDLVADPIGTARRIHRRFGLPIAPGFDEAARDFLAANPRHKLGRHRYALAEFGLDGAAVDRAFASYHSWRAGARLSPAASSAAGAR